MAVSGRSLRLPIYSNNWQTLRFRSRSAISFIPAHRFRIVVAQTSSHGNANARESHYFPTYWRNSPLCARGPRHKGIWRLWRVYVRAACRAVPCRGSRVTRNDNVSPPVVYAEFAKRNPQPPRHTPGSSIIGTPSIYTRVDRYDFSRTRTHASR